MALDQKDFELIEKITYQNSDDVAVAISRSFERLEGRYDAAESRIQIRMSELEDKIDNLRQEFSEEIFHLKSEIRDFARIREKAEWE